MKVYDPWENLPIYINEEEVSSVEFTTQSLVPWDKRDKNNGMIEVLIFMLKGNNRFINVKSEQWLKDKYNLES